MPKPHDVPPCPAAPVAPQSGRVSRDYRIELITPMFGGGVEPRVNDPSFPIRPTTIRGQLEFWWRATVGAQYATLGELRAAQSAVWGDTTQASRVQVRVELLDEPSKPKACAVIKSNHKKVFWEPPFQNTALSYALFPFQGKPANKEGPKVDPSQCIHKASFLLTVITHKSIDFAKQVEPAVWAWVNFGGLGGRTRRGCGAILCKELAPKDRNDLIRLCEPFLLNARAPQDWPTLAAAILVGGEQPNAIGAWHHVIERFRQFRQGVGFGRNQGQQQNRPGRSRFPEPDTIRRITKKWKSNHTPECATDGFPRADFGLPIVFHFKDDRAGDPPDTVLYPPNGSDGKPRERMASPFILKPLALGNGKALPLILRLKSPDLAGVDLRQKVQGKEQSLPLPNPTHIRDAALAGYTNSPLARSPNGSALEAFLAEAAAQGFTEVTP